MRARILALILPAAALLAACGADEPEPGESEPRPAETAEELPRLPRGWEPHANPAAGFALGRPPGWSAREDGAITVLTAPDELVVVSISADRTSEALELEPGEFARATLGALAGYEPSLDAARTERFGHRYAAAEARANGVAAKSGVRQEVRVIAMRRDRLAVITAVLAANAERRTAAEQAQALQALRTLRTRPVG